MNNYTIVVDTACDISQQTLAEWGVKFASLTFRFEGEDKEYQNFDMDSKEFYGYMRAGRIARTAAVNIHSLASLFEEELQKGNDVMYFAVSSGLSTTYNTGCLAAQELKEKYPDKKIIVVDTLAASAGQGLILYLAVQQKNEGKTIEEVAEYIEGIKLNLCHWFTVDNLDYLKRGGRVSPTVAFVGNALGIKPFLHVDDEGHLVNYSKARGRKAALKAFIDKYGELALNPTETDTVFVSHADCIDDVKMVEDMLKAEYGVGFKYVADIGPVIGAHAGPGTIAVFFLGKNR